MLGLTTLGFASVSCWRKVGKRVVPARGTSSTGVGAAAERPRRERIANAVVEARIANVVFEANEDLVKFLKND